jgi:hypothetical protein
MNLPRVRFTVRRLMVVVAIVAIAIWVFYIRREEFHSLALYHNKQSYQHGVMVNVGRGMSLHQPNAKGQWHLKLAQKYSYAASHPYLPVAPDPPEPK